MSGTYQTEIDRGYARATAFDGVIGSELPDIGRFQPHLEVLEHKFSALKRAGLLPRVILTPMARWNQWIAAYKKNQTPLRATPAILAYRGHRDYQRYAVGSWVAAVMGRPLDQGSPAFEKLRTRPSGHPDSVPDGRAPLLATLLAACVKGCEAQKPPAMPYTLTRDTSIGGLPYQVGCFPGEIQEVHYGPDLPVIHEVPPGVHIKLAPLGRLGVGAFNPTILATEVDPCIKPVTA
jgi:hypothetical protein